MNLPGESSDWIFINYYFHLGYEIIPIYISNVQVPQYKKENIKKKENEFIFMRRKHLEHKLEAQCYKLELLI